MSKNLPLKGIPTPVRLTSMDFVPEGLFPRAHRCIGGLSEGSQGISSGGTTARLSGQ